MRSYGIFETELAAPFVARDGEVLHLLELDFRVRYLDGRGAEVEEVVRATPEQTLRARNALFLSRAAGAANAPLPLEAFDDRFVDAQRRAVKP